MNYAYQAAMKLTNNEATVAWEYANFLGAKFYDKPAEAQVLGTIKSPKNPILAGVIRHQLEKDRFWLQIVKAHYENSLMSAESAGKVRKQKSQIYRVFGIY